MILNESTQRRVRTVCRMSFWIYLQEQNSNNVDDTHLHILCIHRYYIKTRKMYAPIYSTYKIDITITKRPLCSKWKGTKPEWRRNKRRTHNGNCCKVRTSNSVKTWAKVVGIGGQHPPPPYRHRNNIKINFVFLPIIIVIIVYCSFIFIKHLPITPLCSIHSLFQCCHVK